MEGARCLSPCQGENERRCGARERVLFQRAGRAIMEPLSRSRAGVRAALITTAVSCGAG